MSSFRPLSTTPAQSRALAGASRLLRGERGQDAALGLLIDAGFSADHAWRIVKDLVDQGKARL